MGKIINELKQKVQADYDAAAAKVKEAELAARNAAETVDITLPAKTRTVGGPDSYTHLMIILAFTSKNSMAPKAEGIPYDKGSR